MADEEDKVKVELEMPKDQVSVHSASDNGEVSGFSEKKDINTEEIKERQDKAVEALKETRDELSKTKKEVEELKERVEGSEEDDGESMVKQTTGYELGEIIGAPLSPPEPEAKGKPKLSQLRIVLLGFAIVLAGVILWPIFTFAIGLSVIIVGAVFVAIGVLVRI